MIEYQKILNTLTDLDSHPRLSYAALLKTQYADQISNLSELLNSTNARQIIFHIKQQSVLIPTCNCGTQLKWNSDLREYRTYCSPKCTATYSTIVKKEKNLETLGVEWHTQTADWKSKVKSTSLEKYGTEHYSQTTEYKQRVVNSNLEKYNVSHVMHLPSTKQKIKNTNLVRYGVDNPAKNCEVQTKIKDTNLIRYGYTNPLLNLDIQQKIKNTNISKYGYTNPLCNASIREKSVITKRENYFPVDTLEKITNATWLENEQHSGKTVHEIANDIGISSSQLCKIFHSLNINIIRHTASELERRLYLHYEQKGVKIITNNRTLISPKELDLYFPDYNLAIEVNGCYYHSEQFNKLQYYHLQKTNACLEQNIALLQFWDTELNEKWEQTINLIDSRLGLHAKLYARHTKLCIVNSSEKARFILDHHLQGDVTSLINLGLYDNTNRLIMVATFGKPRFTNTANTFELLRLCSLSNLQIVGGASKLINHFIKCYMKPNDVLLSYCNRRYSTGNVYYKLGFTLESASPPGFFYIDKAGKYAGSRYQWQKHLMKHKLPMFDETLSASQNMTNNRFFKVWDCGQLVFKLKKQ